MTVPHEKCNLSPRKECKTVSKLVPSLQARPKCVELPKEICVPVMKPRKVMFDSKQLNCWPSAKEKRGISKGVYKKAFTKTLKKYSLSIFETDGCGR